MTKNRLIVFSLSGILVLTGGWYWLTHRNTEFYGGVKPYMEKMLKFHTATAKKLNTGKNLPADFTPMEQLAQTAQDIFAVFGNNPLKKDLRFDPLAVELMRTASVLEYSWDAGQAARTRQTFTALTNTCNTCHRQLVNHKIPDITP